MKIEHVQGRELLDPRGNPTVEATVFLEDGLAQEDWEGFALLKQKTDNRVQIVGDDLFVTNPDRVLKGIAPDAANSVLIKVNQIGTITEALGTIHLALAHGMTAIISHRSGDTELPFESDFSVGTGVGRILRSSEKARRQPVGWVLNPRVKDRLARVTAWVKDPPYEHPEAIVHPLRVRRRTVNGCAQDDKRGARIHFIPQDTRGSKSGEVHRRHSSLVHFS